VEEAALDEEGLVDLLKCFGLLADRHGKRADADRAAAELVDEDSQDPSVHLVKPCLIHLEGGQRLTCERTGDPALTLHGGVVAGPLEEAVGDEAKLRLCRAIRRLEREFAINLGTVCYKFLEKETRPTPRVQQQVMDYVACWRLLDDGSRDLVVSVDRVREVDRLAEGDPEWASSRGF